MRSDDFIYFWFPHMRVLIRTRDKNVIYRNRGLRNSIEIAPTVDMLLCISQWRCPIHPESGSYNIADVYSDHAFPKSSPDTPTSDPALPST